MNNDPMIEFFHIVPGAPMPMPADASLDGSIPLRAFKYCEPFTTANACGWYLFPPIDFDLKWDGHACLWRLAAGKGRWSILHTAVPAEFVEPLQKHAASMGLEYSGALPLLSHAPEYGIIQVWSGLVVRTKPGWVSLVRSLVNFPNEAAIDVLEGIIETDWWVGPLFSVLRVTKSDVTIEFRKKRPFAQVQLINRGAYSQTTRESSKGHPGIDTWPPDIARQFGETLTTLAVRSRPGTYKRMVRARIQK
jgi:hypothetical protein